MYTERQDDRFGGRVIKETKGKGGYLEKYPFFDWEPVKLFEKWCSMLIFVFCEKQLWLHDFELFLKQSILSQ